MLYPTELRARSGADPPAKDDGVLHPPNTTTRPRCAGPLGRFTAALISVSASSTAFTSRTRSGIFITTSSAWLGRHVLPGTPARYTTIYKAFRTGFHARGRARGRTRHHPSQLTETSAMPTRYWIILALSLLAGIAVLFSRPTGHRPRSSAPWRGQVKPPPPPP